MRKEKDRLKRVRDIVLEYEKGAIAAREQTVGDAHTRALCRAIRGAMRSLTPRQREFLLMYYRDELTMREIAKRCGVLPSDVSHTIRRAKEKLREVVQIFSGDEE